MMMPLIGVIIIALMLGIVWFWESTGRELYFYKNVVVLNQDVKRGALISEKMLSLKKIEADHLIENAILDSSQIIGLEAKHFIPKGSQLHSFYFESPDLLTDENTYVVRVPNEWLYSIPNTLRRKDHVLFYPIDQTNKELNQTANINQQQDEIIHTYTLEESKEWSKRLGKEILAAKIAYVKDSANREVQTAGIQDRIDGTSIISEVLILTTPEQFQRLEQTVKDGSKLIIMYTEEEKE